MSLCSTAFDKFLIYELGYSF